MYLPTVVGCTSFSLIYLLLQQSMQIFSYAKQQQQYDGTNDLPVAIVNGENTRPIVGILSIEITRFIRSHYPKNDFISYIPATYVKFVEGSGGRVVPIWIDQPREYYKKMLSKVNGVLLPGGALFFNDSHGYTAAGRHIYDIAMEMNERGVHMTLWGACLGFQLFAYLTANNRDLRTKCQAVKQALPLKLNNIGIQSRMFGQVNKELLDLMQNHNVATHAHQYCITPKSLAANKLLETWRILIVNHDLNGAEFVSAMEHTKYPFYGVQFHPEKTLYEFLIGHNITHSAQAVRVAQYFGNFLLQEVRKNHQRFDNVQEETEALIYNYAPLYTGPEGSVFMQQYIFTRADTVMQRYRDRRIAAAGEAIDQEYTPLELEAKPKQQPSDGFGGAPVAATDQHGVCGGVDTVDATAATRDAIDDAATETTETSSLSILSPTSWTTMFSMKCNCDSSNTMIEFTALLAGLMTSLICLWFFTCK